jgi:hypothetical protein
MQDGVSPSGCASRVLRSEQRPLFCELIAERRRYVRYDRSGHSHPYLPARSRVCRAAPYFRQERIELSADEEAHRGQPDDGGQGHRGNKRRLIHDARALRAEG